MTHPIIPLLIVSSLLLASCGQDGIEPRVSTPPSKKMVVENTQSPVQNNTGILSTNQANTGTTSTGKAEYETINGIEVPPEPDPALNNATLEGVDLNENGVRDDVERKIAEKSVNITNYNKTFAQAKIYQDMISKSISNRNEAIALLKKQNCINQEVGIIEKIFTLPDSTYNFALLTADTVSRKKMLNNFNFILGGADAEEIQCN